MSVNLQEFKLCPTGWKLYDDWCIEEERHSSEKAPARKAYIAHRKACKECTPYVIHNSPMEDEDVHKSA